MKLRNKKTGEIVEFGSMRQYWREEKDGGMAYLFQKQGDNVGIVYNSLAELNEEWEDYKPAEPFIKDEKVCKLIRAWSDFINDNELTIRVDKEEDDTFCDYNFLVNKHLFMRFFMRRVDGLESGEYTIAELCGEEEE